jgi:hypothetical protein
MNQPLQTVEPVTALVTLDPENYAAAVYEPFKARLETAIANAKGVTYNIQTKEGMALAKEHRAVLRAIRIDADKERAARKAPITAIGKLLESKYTEIEAAVTPHEDKFNADIKAEEERIETEKAAKLKAEEEAKAAIQNKIDAIKNKPLEVMNKTVEDIETAIAELSPLIPTPTEYGERFIEAEFALKATLDTLQNILNGKKAQEQLEAQNRALQAEQEAKAAADIAAAHEQARINKIKAKIQSIRNFVIEGSECDFSSQVRALMETVDNMAIISIEYDEFESEANEARTKTIAALSRQLKVLEQTEKEEAEAKARIEAELKAELEEAAAKTPLVDKNDTINESDFNKVFADTVSTGTGVPNVSLSDANVITASHIPVAQMTGKRPTAQAIINLVATTYKVDSDTASRWLAQSFGELKAA